jgi:hypothetical protein
MPGGREEKMQAMRGVVRGAVKIAVRSEVLMKAEFRFQNSDFLNSDQSSSVEFLSIF